jgi:hypothetical protein
MSLLHRSQLILLWVPSRVDELGGALEDLTEGLLSPLLEPTPSKSRAAGTLKSGRRASDFSGAPAPPRS